MNDKEISLISTVSGKIPHAKGARRQTSNTIMDELLASRDAKKNGEDSVSAQARRSSQLEIAHPTSLPLFKAASKAMSGTSSSSDLCGSDDNNRWMDVVATCIGVAAVGAAIVALSGPLALAVATAGARLVFAGITSEVSEDGLPSVAQKVGGAFVAGMILPYSTTAAIAATVASELLVSVDPEGTISFGLPSQFKLTPLLVTMIALIALTRSGVKRRNAVDTVSRRFLGIKRRLRGHVGGRSDR